MKCTLKVLTFAVSLFASGATAQSVVFDDVALETNTLNPSFGRGAAMADLDQDGRLDLICADANQPNQFYRQKADGTFEDAASLWGVGVVVEFEWGVLAADFDNDGDDDVYFANGGFSNNDYPGRPFPNQLLRNDIGTLGSLTDVTSQSGDGSNPDPTFGAVALDYDRDGFLDIFCSDRQRSCKLLRNEGGLSFDDVSAQANIVKIADWRHSGASDFDVDGWPDVGVGGGGGANALYHNQQDGGFIDRAVQAGVFNPNDNFGMVFQDYDNDGYPDVYIPKYQLNPSGPSPVYLNNGDGTFRNVSPGSGIGAHTDMGHESGDVDGDGYPDIMMGTGNPTFSDFDYLYTVVPDGSGGLTITDVSSPSNFDSSGLSRQHGQALGDYDRDGDIDVYCNNGGPDWIANSIQANFFWRNRGNANAWAAFELDGVYSNRTGVGVVGKAMTVEGRDVYRTLQVGRGFTNTPDHALHFGLGTDSGVERLELRWPSGIVQLVDEPPTGAYTAVVETGALLRGTPTVGQTFTFDLAGAPSDYAVLGFSLGTTTVELDGVNGPLHLAPPYIQLPAFQLNAAGRLSLPIPLPNNPALVGLTFHSQAWIYSVPGLGTLSQLHSFTLQ